MRGWLKDQPITLSLKRGSLAVALDLEDERASDPVLVFDRAGRLWSFYIQGHHLRRGWNGRILAKWNEQGQRQRRRLCSGAASLVVWRASLIARRLHDDLRLEGPAPVSRQVRQVLSRAAAFDAPAARADVERYRRIYKPIGILPPDQYMALVLQVTEGCSFNTCTFCTFYKDRLFRVKSPQELREHILALRAFLGESILMRRNLFLADANALVVPQRQLLELLDVVTEELGSDQELFAFLDGFSGRKKSAQDYTALAARGVRRIYVGLESGHDPLLSWLHKPGRAVDAVTAVRRIKAGGVNVGVIVMLGIGGQRYAKGHVRDTIVALRQMALGRGDLLYFSQFIPYGTPYEIQADARDLWTLGGVEMQAQREAIVAGLSFEKSSPKIATYNINEFVY